MVQIEVLRVSPARRKACVVCRTFGTVEIDLTSGKGASKERIPWIVLCEPCAATLLVEMGKHAR
jgi:hypothetical protein